MYNLKQRMSTLSVGLYENLKKKLGKAYKKDKKGRTTKHAQQRFLEVFSTERLKPSLEEVRLVCEELGMSISEFMDESFLFNEAERRMEDEQVDQLASELGLGRAA